MKKIITILALVNICSVIFYLVRWYTTRPVYTHVTALTENEMQRETKFLTHGGISVNNARRLIVVKQQANKSQTISDSDMSFVCDVMRQSFIKDDLDSLYLRSQILHIWRSASKMSQAQRSKVIELASEVFSRPDATFDLGSKKMVAADKILTAKTIGKMNDKRGVTVLMPLLDHKDRVVIATTKTALSNLGYKENAK